MAGPAQGARRAAWLRRLALALTLALLALLPVAWTAPLARAGLLPWFGGSEISIFGVVAALWESDPWLSALVGLLAVVLPWGKLLLVLGLLLGRVPEGWRPALEAAGRLAMADVFLIALYIVLAKGVGIGTVTPAWGLWLFTGCVLGSMAVTRLAPRGRAA